MPESVSSSSQSSPLRAALAGGDLERGAEVRQSRSMRRPIDRKRQPVPRVMPSSTKPDSVIIAVTARSSQASASGSAAMPTAALEHRVGDELVERAPVVGRHAVAQVEGHARELAQPFAEAPVRMGRGAQQAAWPRRRLRSRPKRSASASAGARPVCRPGSSSSWRWRSPRAAGARWHRSARRSGRTRTGSRRRATTGWCAR